MYTSPIWVTLFARVVFREKIGKRKLVALLMAFAGCILVSGITGGVGRVSMEGLLLGLGSGIGYGLYSIFGRIALEKGYHPMTVSAYTFLFACVGVLFLALSVPVNMLYQSIRKPGMSSFLSLLRSGLTFMPTLIITTSLWGLTGIQISQPMADIATGLISVPFIVAFLRKEFPEE